MDIDDLTREIDDIRSNHGALVLSQHRRPQLALTNWKHNDDGAPNAVIRWVHPLQVMNHSQFEELIFNMREVN